MAVGVGDIDKTSVAHGDTMTTDDLLEKLDGQLAQWPLASRTLAQRLTEKYGPPHEVRFEQLEWRRNGPWKRTTLHRDGAEHRWPAPHADVLEQVLDHAVRPEQAGLLAAFHGSLLADRTRGEIVLRCVDEPANLLAANLAHDILEGACTPHAARAVYARLFPVRHASAEAVVQRLRFGQMVATADPDEPDERRDPPRPRRSRTEPPRTMRHGTGPST